MPGEVPPCFVVTAPHSGEARRESARSQLDRAGIDHVMTVGFGPQSEAVSRLYSPWRNAVLNKRPLTPGEVAAYLGHRKAWRAVADSGTPSGLVLEDDFRFVDPTRAAGIVAAAADHLGRWDIIKLFDYRPRRTLALVKGDGVTLALHARPSHGFVGYLISARCCRRLLKRRHVFRPVDHDICHSFETGLRVASVQPSVVADDGEALDGSLLEEARRAERATLSRSRRAYGRLLSAYLKVGSWLWSRRIARELEASSPDVRCDAQERRLERISVLSREDQPRD